MTQAPATPELVERLHQAGSRLGPLTRYGEDAVWRPATRARDALIDAAAALEAQQARIAELEEVLKGTLLDWQTLAQRQAYFAAPLNVAKIEAALSSQGRHEGGAFDLLKLAEVATKAVYTHGFGFREVVGPSERDGKVYVNFAWDDDRLVRAIFFVSPGEEPSPDNTNPKAGAPEHGV